MISTRLLAAIEGFGFGIPFVFSLGPQNTLLLTEGACGRSILMVAGICFVFDAALLTSTASGLLLIMPTMIIWLRWAGLAFLLGCGLRALRAAFYPANQDVAVVNAATPLIAAFVVSAANPLVWLETALLTGGIALQFSGSARAACVAGAVTASALRIFGLGYGARWAGQWLPGVVATGAANAVIAAVMLGYAVMLLSSLVQASQ